MVDRCQIGRNGELVIGGGQDAMSGGDFEFGAVAEAFDANLSLADVETGCAGIRLNHELGSEHLHDGGGRLDN